MLGNFIKSTLNVSGLLWEVVGACCLPAIAFFFYDVRKHWREAWPYLAIGGFVGACAWRLYFNIHSGRHYSVLILPLMLVLFHFGWSIFPRRARILKYALLVTFLALCLGRDLRFNPQKAKILSLYQKVAEDARAYRSPWGIAFPSQGAREEFYAQIPVGGIPYGAKDTAEFFRGLRGNWNIYRNFNDVIYMFITVPGNLPDKERIFQEFRRDGAELVGREYLDRRRRKELSVWKYVTRPEGYDLDGATLLPNGDFSQMLTGEARAKKLAYLGRRAPRFIREKPELPCNWEFYQSLTLFSHSLAKIERRDGGNALRLQADSYMVALSPFFDITQPREFFFRIKANRMSTLLIRREYRDPGALLSESIMLKLLPSAEKQYRLKLPAGNGKRIGHIWFWLTDGDIELRDVRIK